MTITELKRKILNFSKHYFPFFHENVVVPVGLPIKQLFFPSKGQVEIDNKGKIYIHGRIEFYIVNGCNLKCSYCSHFNPIRKGIVPLEELTQWFSNWSTKIKPASIWLLGGEPLMHPQIIKIVAQVRKYWQDLDNLTIVTNGRLIHRLSEETLKSLRDLDVQFDISPHDDSKTFEITKKETEQRLNKVGLCYTWNTSDQVWQPFYQLNEHGHPFPYKSDPIIAYKNCPQKHCRAINHNRLFICSYLANIYAACKEGVLSDAWETVATTSSSVGPEASSKEIFAYLTGGALPECHICKDQNIIISPRDLEKHE